MPGPQRIWFPNAPDGTIDAEDRRDHAVGFGPSSGVVVNINTYRFIFTTDTFRRTMSTDTTRRVFTKTSDRIDLGA